MTNSRSRRWPRVLRSELVIWALGVVTAVVGHGAASTVFDAAEGHWSQGLIWWNLGFLGLTALLYLGYENPLPERLSRALKARVFLRGSVPWLLGATAAIALFGVATCLHRSVSNEEPGNTPLLLAYVVAFAVLAIPLYLLRNDLLIIHTRYLEQETVTDKGTDRSHLVVILSDVPKGIADNRGLPSWIAWSDPPNLRDDLAALVAAKKPGQMWSWEPLLRGIWPHASRQLTDVTLICSERSLAQVPLVVGVIDRYTELRSRSTNLNISVWALRGDTLIQADARSDNELQGLKGFNFNQIDDLSGAIADLMKYLRLIKKIPPGKVLVDLTGGQKPISVVAAAVTFRSELMAQYVDTNTVDVITYDVVANAETRTV